MFINDEDDTPKTTIPEMYFLFFNFFFIFDNAFLSLERNKIYLTEIYQFLFLGMSCKNRKTFKISLNKYKNL